jgi:O-antigen/teichoic acid export membrane protein
MAPSVGFGSIRPDLFIERRMRTTRNTFYNIVGQGLPLLVAIFAIPPVIRGLGTERFGLLAIGWVILGYFGALDLGVGRATTKLVAERAHDRDAEGVAAVTWTSVLLQTALGTAAGLLFAGVAPLLVRDVLRIPPGLEDEAQRTFRILAVGLPLGLISNAFRGVIEGSHRFDLAALVRVPLGSATYLVPLLGVWAGLDLPGICAAMVAVRALGAVAYAVLCGRVWPGILRARLAGAVMARRIVGFGGWIALSGALIPLFVYLDRFLIGALRSLAEVTYYTAPSELVSRLLFVPAGLAGVLFPLFSDLAARGDRTRIRARLSAATRWTALLMAPVAAVIVVGAPAMLGLWLDQEMAARSTGVLRLLAAALFLNALGFPAVALVEGVGRPDVVAKYHLVELPLYAAVAALLVASGGILGAAVAWLLRMAFTIPVFFALCARAAGVRAGDVVGGATGRALALSTGLLAATAIASVTLPPALAYAIVATMLLAFGILAWRVALDDEDRRSARHTPLTWVLGIERGPSQ